MIQSTFQCRDCGSANIVKHGHNASGNQQYHCRACGTYGVLAKKSYTEQQKERILRAYRERGSMRAISRIFGVSTLSRWPAKRQLKRNAKPNR